MAKEFEVDEQAMKVVSAHESVRGVDLSLAEARELIDGEVPDDLAEAVDFAQGEVGTGSESEAYVLIRIRR